MKILIVEDDNLQSPWLIRTLKEAFIGCEVALCETEFGFQSRFQAMVANPPDLVTMDIMLRWDDHGFDTPDGPYRAGFRCIEMMRREPKLREVPVVIYTILESSDIALDLNSMSERDRFVRKTADPTVLLNTVRELLHG